MHQIAPVPNHNGSPADALAEQMMEVCHALEAAVTLMARWQPHGRDYQIGGDYQADRTVFLRRLRLVEELAQQYETEGVAVSDYHYKKARV
jgi:DNA-directed RNA polymerase sigma subunit (sigma70/sigma32)